MTTDGLSPSYVFGARHPSAQARRGSVVGIADGGVTPPGGMSRPDNVTPRRRGCTRARILAPFLFCACVVTVATAQDLSTIQDRLAIADHLTQYSYRWDSKDSVGFARLFTDDGIMERWRGGKRVDGSQVVGRQAILGYAKTSHEGRLADRQTRHHFSGLVFLELSPEAAVTENMALITHQTAEDRVPFISGSGVYRNTWKKTAEGWRIAKRLLFTDRFIAP